MCPPRGVERITYSGFDTGAFASIRGGRTESLLWHVAISQGLQTTWSMRGLSPNSGTEATSSGLKGHLTTRCPGKSSVRLDVCVAWSHLATLPGAPK